MSDKMTSFRVSWSNKIEDRLAYQVYERLLGERGLAKDLFVNLMLEIKDMSLEEIKELSQVNKNKFLSSISIDPVQKPEKKKNIEGATQVEEKTIERNKKLSIENQKSNATRALFS